MARSTLTPQTQGAAVVPIIVLLVVVAALGAVAVVLAGRTGGQAEYAPDRPRFALPDGPIQPEDIDSVRFAVGVRGYRMGQVDAILDRLAAELADRDQQLAAMRGDVDPAAAADVDDLDARHVPDVDALAESSEDVTDHD